MSTVSQNLDQAFSNLGKIEATSSRIEKIKFLLELNDNQIAKDLLYRAYNPFLMYKVKKLPVVNPREGDLNSIANYQAFTQLTDKLFDGGLTGNSAIIKIAQFLSGCNKVEHKWYSLIIKKDLNIGIQSKTINEALGYLIPIFDCMLAQPFREYPSEGIIQPKLDGVRILGDTDTGLLYSRKGKLVSGFEDLEAEVKKLPGGLMIDGEIMSGTFNNLISLAFTNISGKQGVLHAFDILSKKEFFNGMSIDPYLIRDYRLGEILDEYKPDYIRRVEGSEILNFTNEHHIKRAEQLYEYYLSIGLEGGMVKDVNSYYEGKRSYSWQKLKPTKTFDIRVIAVEEGKDGTKYIERVGRLVCEYKGNEVRVGSGLSDEQRLAWWLDPTQIVGKIIEVVGQEETSNKMGTTSIRFPRYKRLRPDK